MTINVIIYHNVLQVITESSNPKTIPATMCSISQQNIVVYHKKWYIRYNNNFWGSMLSNPTRKAQRFCDMQICTHEKSYWHPFVKSLYFVVCSRNRSVFGSENYRSSVIAIHVINYRCGNPLKYQFQRISVKLGKGRQPFTGLGNYVSKYW